LSSNKLTTTAYLELGGLATGILWKGSSFATFYGTFLVDRANPIIIGIPTPSFPIYKSLLKSMAS